MMSLAPASITTVAVIGTGTIGASWTTLFIGHGLNVVATDPAPDAAARLEAFVSRALPAVRRASSQRQGRLTFVGSAEAAGATADLVQENAPERADTKAELIARLEGAVPAHAIIASSTTALTHSVISARARAPERVIVAHPFNPPHLVPLVELVGQTPDCPAVRRACAFYTQLGREPVILKKEAVGHVANRLQAALMREALYILEQGIADVEDIDKAVRFGPGLRWSFMGPFQTIHLAGGAGGMRHYLAHLFQSQHDRWAALGTPQVDDALRARMLDGIDRMVGERSIIELEAERDGRLAAVLAALRPDRRGEA